MMAKGNDMGEEVKVEEEEGYLREDKREHSFALLLRVTQASGKPLPIGGFTGTAMAQIYEIAGVTLWEVVILTDHEVVVELVWKHLYWKCQEQYMGSINGMGNPYL